VTGDENVSLVAVVALVAVVIEKLENQYKKFTM